jgi:hypothetical protein
MLLEPTMNRTENCVYPVYWVVFSSHCWDFEELSESKGLCGAQKCTKVLECDFKQNFPKAIFRIYESEISLGPVLHWTKPD